MSESKHFEDYLEGNSELSRQYREGAREEPPAALDQAILAKASRAVEADRRRPGGAFGGRRSRAFSLAAVVVLTVTVVVLLPEERPSDPAGVMQLPTRSDALPPPAPASAPNPAPDPDPAPAPESDTAPAVRALQAPAARLVPTEEAGASAGRAAGESRQLAAPPPARSQPGSARPPDAPMDRDEESTATRVAPAVTTEAVEAGQSTAGASAAGKTAPGASLDQAAPPAGDLRAKKMLRSPADQTGAGREAPSLTSAPTRAHGQALDRASEQLELEQAAELPPGAAGAAPAAELRAPSAAPPSAPFRPYVTESFSVSNPDEATEDTPERNRLELHRERGRPDPEAPAAGSRSALPAPASSAEQPVRAKQEAMDAAMDTEPRRWIERIEAAADAGDLALARELLQTFSRRFPDYPVDEALLRRLEP